MAQLSAVLRPNASSKLTGALDLQSKWRGAETGVVEGEGDLQLADGKLEGVKILQDLAAILRVKELDSPVISSAQTHFVVANQNTHFTGLQINSPVFQMTGDGDIGFDGSLRADMC